MFVSDTILPGNLCSEKIILHICIGLSMMSPLTANNSLHFHFELAVLIYNAKIVLVINGKYASSHRFIWPSWYFCGILFCPWAVLPGNQGM